MHIRDRIRNLLGVYLHIRDHSTIPNSCRPSWERANAFAYTTWLIAVRERRPHRNPLQKYWPSVNDLIVLATSIKHANTIATDVENCLPSTLCAVPQGLGGNIVPSSGALIQLTSTLSSIGFINVQVVLIICKAPVIQKYIPYVRCHARIKLPPCANDFAKACSFKRVASSLLRS